MVLLKTRKPTPKRWRPMAPKCRSVPDVAPDICPAAFESYRQSINDHLTPAIRECGRTVELLQRPSTSKPRKRVCAFCRPVLPQADTLFWKTCGTERTDPRADHVAGEQSGGCSRRCSQQTAPHCSSAKRNRETHRDHPRTGRIPLPAERNHPYLRRNPRQNRGGRGLPCPRAGVRPRDGGEPARRADETADCDPCADVGDRGRSPPDD